MQDPQWNSSPPGVRPGQLMDRWRALNGAISKEQLAWLEGELRAAQAQGRRVIVACHCPMHPRAVPGVTATLLWNYEAVLDVLWRYPGVVAATLAGARPSQLAGCFHAAPFGTHVLPHGLRCQARA